MTTSLAIPLALALTLCTIFYFATFSKQSKLPLPPGPRGVPLLGNLHGLPKPGELEYEFWTKHKDLYGAISSVTVLGQTIIIINSADLAIELLEKRAALHSLRPKMTFAGDMCGWSKIMLFQVSERLRAYRRQFHAIIGTPSALSKFTPLLETEVKRFLVRVLDTPDDLLQHVRTEASAIILKLTYGYDIEPRKQDPLVKLAENALVQFSHAAAAGAWLVDFVPPLKHVPDWMPGTTFKRTARAWRKTLLALGNVPMRFAQQRMKDVHSTPSFISGLYENAGGHLSAEEEDIAKWSAASMYAGGADTSVSSMQLFFLAMTLHPEIQRTAQAELDSVIGTARLPTLSDRPHLPYLSALVSEVLRWHVVAPFGLPHVATAEDSIAGYRIPAHATLLANIWWFTHDPDTYSDPMTFRPARFLGPAPERDPRDFVFGFGRRRCPGKVLADASVWLTCAMSLAALVVGKGVDAEGREVEAEVRFTSGVISHPVPFRASVAARGREWEALVRAVEQTDPWVEGSSGELEGLEGVES